MGLSSLHLDAFFAAAQSLNFSQAAKELHITQSALSQRIKALEEESKTAPESRQAQISTSLTALKSTRIEAVNEYNSKAAQEHRSAFKDRDLPPRLDVNDMNTTCAP